MNLASSFVFMGGVVLVCLVPASSPVCTQFHMYLTLGPCVTQHAPPDFPFLGIILSENFDINVFIKQMCLGIELGPLTALVNCTHVQTNSLSCPEEKLVLLLQVLKPTYVPALCRLTDYVEAGGGECRNLTDSFLNLHSCYTRFVNVTNNGTRGNDICQASSQLSTCVTTAVASCPHLLHLPYYPETSGYWLQHLRPQCPGLVVPTPLPSHSPSSTSPWVTSATTVVTTSVAVAAGSTTPDASSEAVSSASVARPGKLFYLLGFMCGVLLLFIQS